MKIAYLVSAAALALVATPAVAQHGGHGGHTTPATTTPPIADPVSAQRADHRHHEAAPEAKGEDHSQHGAGHAMSGAYGPYPAAREASGTAWQPDRSRHGGLHTRSGDWMLMGHTLLNGVYDWQQGPRGGEKFFVSGMAMGMARRDFASGDVLQLRAMLSPDPLMGKRGYPLLLASGETANGVDPLIDRQHPHDLFVELSASYSARLSDRASVFIYGGLPGQPAFGPPAFMHRTSIMDSPEAPISHHWLDSTHITFGVVTAGFVYGPAKIEASRFHGREPDQHRYDIETGALDSTAIRLSLNPTRELALQGSWAHLKSPEQLEPDENQTRWSASAIYTRPLGRDGWWSSTLAWGRRSSGHEQLDAYLIESAAGWREWTLFGRAEKTENNELTSVGGHHGPTYDVAKASFGLIRDFEIASRVKLGFGGLYAFNFVPDPLDPLYGRSPNGAMAFIRLKID
ncbi:MAG TPA: hypothetical protein VGB59_07840 [Allosphingosinicella sp.]